MKDVVYSYNRGAQVSKLTGIPINRYCKVWVLVHAFIKFRGMLFTYYALFVKCMHLINGYSIKMKYSW